MRYPEPEGERAEQPRGDEDSPAAGVTELGLGDDDERERAREDEEEDRVVQWFRTYFAASRNSGCAISIYASLSVLPAALVFVAAFYSPGGSVNTFAQHLVNHLNLTGSTATLVEGTFGTASSNALAASVTVIVSFLLWGIGIGQLYQRPWSAAEPTLTCQARA